ncbi:hypothetical protein CMV_012097 [Castanea mollissima]|uniref:Uncharacterized protein n=1 Tax=Castanea mollissima TaxID=60419 RepID=A0A8J4RFH4_9ROSI|nr:hypothetical protein CMV_012097 [Castanea mollissima]
MAKSTSTCKKRRTQKKNQNQDGMEFSESEMDVAEQLIQLSGDSSGDQDHTNNNNSVEEENKEDVKAAEQGHKYDAVDVSSTNIGELFFPNNTSLKEEEDDQMILWQRQRRFRCIYDLYNSTNPITLVKAKRRKVTPYIVK